jgi:RNA polymerase sigma-70 factor (ECF subfamily)
MGTPEGEITELLARMTTGDKDAEARLMPLVYSELRRLAATYMRGERTGHTLQATALVHEAFLRLKGSGELNWQSRAHFFAVCAQTMRRILVDHARGVHAQKRAGGMQRIPLESAMVYAEEQSGELLALDEALTRLSAWDQRQCRVVEMRFFAGLDMEEIASVLGVSARTVKRDFSMARAWLYGELTRGQDDGRRPLGTP